MRDLNLGPESKRLIGKHDIAARQQDTDYVFIAELASRMAKLLQRWYDSEWCEPDACPARICKGPHVSVIYDNDKSVTVIEHIDHVGEMFRNVPYTVSRP